MRTPSKYIWADRDLTTLSYPRAIPTRQIYKPRFARNYTEKSRSSEFAAGKYSSVRRTPILAINFDRNTDFRGKNGAPYNRKNTVIGVPMHATDSLIRIISMYVTVPRATRHFCDKKNCTAI